MTGTTGAGRVRRATTTTTPAGALRTVLALVLGAALLAGCGPEEGSPEETVAVKTEAEIDLDAAASAEPAATTTPAEEEDDDGFDGRPATPRPTATPSTAPPPPPPAEGRDRPPLDGLDDRSSVVRDLEIVEGEIPDDAILLEEDFDTTTPRVTPFETVDGEGGIGNFDQTYFYEIVPARATAHVAAPVRDIPLPDSESLYVQGTHFVTSFAGLAAADRGYYCWAADGLDPLSGARYEALLSPDGRIQVVRYGEGGAPEALLIDEVYTPDPEDPEEPDTPAGTVIMGLLCRPDAEGRAQIAVRVEGDYYVTTDDGNHAPGGGAGLVVAGAGPSAPDTIATYGVLFVVDGNRVPFL